MDHGGRLHRYRGHLTNHIGSHRFQLSHLYWLFRYYRDGICQRLWHHRLSRRHLGREHPLTHPDDAGLRFLLSSQQQCLATGIPFRTETSHHRTDRLGCTDADEWQQFHRLQELDHLWCGADGIGKKGGSHTTDPALRDGRTPALPYLRTLPAAVPPPSFHHGSATPIATEKRAQPLPKTIPPERSDPDYSQC